MKINLNLNSTQLIGAPHIRYDSCYKEKGDEWVSYYHGWIEGRVSLIQELAEGK